MLSRESSNAAVAGPSWHLSLRFRHSGEAMGFGGYCVIEHGGKMYNFIPSSALALLMSLDIPPYSEVCRSLPPSLARKFWGDSS